GDENYEPAVPVEQIVRVEKAIQSISFEPPSEIFLEDGSITLSATVNSQLPPRFVVLSGPAILSNGILTPIGIGTIVIEAQQLGDANHEPAAPVERTIRIVEPEVVLRMTATTTSLKL